MLRGLDSVTLDNIQKPFTGNAGITCLPTYIEGHVAGSKLEDTVKKYKTAVKSQCHIGNNE